MKDIILVALCVIISLSLVGKWGLEQKHEKERMEQNLFNKTKEFTTLFCNPYVFKNTVPRFEIIDPDE